MPKMPGIDLIKRLRRIEKVKNISILIVSARNEAKDVKIAIQAGANDYIVKPIDPLIFKTKIDNLTKSTSSEWFTYEVPTSSEDSHLTISLDQKISSINEIGCTVKTKIPLEVGAAIAISSPLFKKIGLDEVICHVASTKNFEGGYINTLLFIGIKEEQRQKLRIMCRTLWYVQEAA